MKFLANKNTFFSTKRIVRMAERSKAPDSRVELFLTGVFWSTNVGVGSNPTSDKVFTTCEMAINGAFWLPWQEKQGVLWVSAGRNWLFLTFLHNLFLGIVLPNSILLRSSGELAQMVERSLSMREVRGSMPRFSTICFQQKNTNSTLWRISHCHIAFCLQNCLGELAQMVERSIRIREARGSIPRFSTRILKEKW